MEFTIPQFIEKESKIVGPLTFRQFLFIGAAAGITIFLYFTLPFFFFVIGGVIIIGASLALAFAKIEKTSLPKYISNLFLFMFKPKVYLWDKKTGAPRYLRQDKKEVKKLTDKKDEKEPALKVSRGSQLGDLFTKLETK